MKATTLFDNRWVSVRQISHSEHGDYVYSHESSCAGRKVVVLPFRAVSVGGCASCDAGGDPASCHEPHMAIEVLLRDELTLCWNPDRTELASITGGWESSDDKLCRATAARELREEGGYRVHEERFIFLGTARGTKTTDTVYYLYAVDLTDDEPTEDGRGDGSELELAASCRWVGDDALLLCADPHAHVAYNRLIAWMMQQFADEDKS